MADLFFLPSCSFLVGSQSMGQLYPLWQTPSLPFQTTLCAFDEL